MRLVEKAQWQRHSKRQQMQTLRARLTVQGALLSFRFGEHQAEAIYHTEQSREVVAVIEGSVSESTSQLNKT